MNYVGVADHLLCTLHFRVLLVWFNYLEVVENRGVLAGSARLTRICLTSRGTLFFVCLLSEPFNPQ